MPEPTKIGVVGPKDIYLGFKSLGLLVMDAHTPREAEAAILELAGQGAAIIFVAEGLAQGLLPLIERFSRQPSPAIVMIPDHRGSLGLARERLRRLVEKAVGIDILAEER
ncbi:MAG: V-type ATP synthase subunit F [Candidatus Acetothermia bacterium]|jgi:V/A-type H+-transporting ATPase subunit F|nr:V-type ATP synthase subunit F [Candidatus Acetothermia bacterium]MDH7505754.1 V-type ATP synthase subunit F [Candidatus Acetothermia bacterium]